MEYLILLPLFALSTAKVAMQGKLSRRCMKNVTDVILYNAIVFAMLGLAFFALNHFCFPSRSTILYGIFYALTNVVFQVCYTCALRSGPVSLTVLISNLSAVMSVIYGVGWCHETLAWYNLLGLGFMGAALVLSVNWAEMKMHTFNRSWFVYTIATMLANGGGSIVLKMQKVACPGENNGMLLMSYGVGAVMLLLCLLGSCRSGRGKCTMRVDGKNLGWMALIALVLAVYMPLYTGAVGVLPLAIFQPLINVGGMVCISVLGIVMFKDRLSHGQIVGLGMGIIAVVLLTLHV